MINSYDGKKLCEGSFVSSKTHKTGALFSVCLINLHRLRLFNKISIPKLKIQIKGQGLNFWHANDSNAKMSTCFDNELLSDKHRGLPGSAPEDSLIGFTVLL